MVETRFYLKRFVTKTTTPDNNLASKNLLKSDDNKLKNLFINELSCTAQSSSFTPKYDKTFRLQHSNSTFPDRKQTKPNPLNCCMETNLLSF